MDFLKKNILTKQRIYIGLLFLFGCAHGAYEAYQHHLRWIAYDKEYGSTHTHDYTPFTNTLFNIFFYSFVIFIIYKPLIRYLEQKDLINPIQNWRRKASKIISITLAFILLIAIIETVEVTGHQTITGVILVGIYILFFVLLSWYYKSYFLKSFSIKNVLQATFLKTHLEKIIITIFLMVLFVLMGIFKENKTYPYIFDIAAVFVTLTIGYVVLSWLLNQYKSIRKLKNEKAHAELLHLKSQVSPHFFFNTLNNLYGLINKNPDSARELVLELSDMMRYTIYEGQKEWVPIEEEITYLKNYIALHKKRYHKKIDIQFFSEVHDHNKRVMPLLFIILLENAFKHGVENIRNNAYIHIQLTVKNRQIRFEIKNNFDPLSLPTTSGIGLRNLKKRLELMYPNRHELLIESDDEVYLVVLEMNSYD